MRLQEAKVLVIGLGGVGTWAAEALARSGVVNIGLVDLDDICSSNIARQLHATQETIGELKTTAMAKRLQAINPSIHIRTWERYYSEKSSDEIFEYRPTIVLDCMDSLKDKIHLAVECNTRDIRLITSGAAGGRRNVSDIQCVDLSKTIQDSLLMRMRKRLRRDHPDKFRKNRKLGILAITSKEQTPVDQKCEGTLNCNTGLGSASYITGSFGLRMAQEAIDSITSD